MNIKDQNEIRNRFQKKTIPTTATVSQSRYYSLRCIWEWIKDFIKGNGLRKPYMRLEYKMDLKGTHAGNVYEKYKMFIRQTSNGKNENIDTTKDFAYRYNTSYNLCICIRMELFLLMTGFEAIGGKGSKRDGYILKDYTLLESFGE